MFAFLTPQTKESADPLQNAKAAAAWLQRLPALDVIGRQQRVLDALDGLRKSPRGFDLHRISAIEYVDAALGADRGQLIKQYIENAGASPKLALRIWQVLWEISQGFTLAYQVALGAAVPRAANARWKAALPLLFVRLVHFHGTDAKLRLFKYERWIPGKWIELHQAYLRACELQCDRQPMALPAAGAVAQAWTVEQEYVFVLLVHQLNTGNLAPSEIAWASSQLRAWSRRLTLEEIPKSEEGFWVDLGGRAGLGDFPAVLVGACLVSSAVCAGFSGAAAAGDSRAAAAGCVARVAATIGPSGGDTSSSSAGAAAGDGSTGSGS